MFVKCSLVLLLVLFARSSDADEHFPLLGRIKEQGINVRAGANTNYERVDQLSQNAQVVLLAKKYEWYQVQLAATAQVYIREDYLKPVSPNVSEVTGDRVNVRARPSSEASSLGQLVKGTLVRVNAPENHWVKIIAPPGIDGWVHEKFIEILSETVSAQQLTKALTLDDIAQAPAVQIPPSPPARVEITAVGFFKPVTKAPVDDIIYQLYVDGKPVYYLINAPDLGRFSSGKVKVVGEIINVSKDTDLPVLRVKDIALVM